MRGDLKKGIAAPSPEHCAWQCIQEPGCLSYTWLKSNGVCYLKGTIPAKREGGGGVSGVGTEPIRKGLRRRPGGTGFFYPPGGPGARKRHFEAIGEGPEVGVTADGEADDSSLGRRATAWREALDKVCVWVAWGFGEGMGVSV